MAVMGMLAVLMTVLLALLLLAGRDPGHDAARHPRHPHHHTPHTPHPAIFSSSDRQLPLPPDIASPGLVRHLQAMQRAASAFPNGTIPLITN